MEFQYLETDNWTKDIMIVKRSTWQSKWVHTGLQEISGSYTHP